MKIRNMRSQDNGNGDPRKQRRLFTAENIRLMLIVATFVLGGRELGGLAIGVSSSSGDHDTIVRLESEWEAHKAAEDVQEELFESKLKNLETKIDGVNEKLEILIRRTE